jgi:hypothetical protein
LALSKDTASIITPKWFALIRDELDMPRAQEPIGLQVIRSLILVEIWKGMS